jgi:hypothetical protein
MHHREPIAEDAHAREPAAVEDGSAPSRLEDREPQQHENSRHELERVRDELICNPERRIRALDAGRRAQLR